MDKIGTIGSIRPTQYIPHGFKPPRNCPFYATLGTVMGLVIRTNSSNNCPK